MNECANGDIHEAVASRSSHIHRERLCVCIVGWLIHLDYLALEGGTGDVYIFEIICIDNHDLLEILH